METRTLAVSALSKPNKSSQYIPFIRLLGDWLARAGFQPGDRVTVQVTANTDGEPVRIIITRQ